MVSTGISSYPRTVGGTYSTSIIDDIIDYMDAHGLTVYRMSIYYDVADATRNAMISYFLSNCSYDLIVCRHVYNAGGGLLGDDTWEDVLSWVLSVLSTFSAYQSRLKVEFVNEYGLSDLASQCQTVVTAVRAAGYTAGLVACKWNQTWSSMAGVTDPLDEFYSGMHFYFKSGAWSTAESQMNTALGLGIKIINTEIGADYDEHYTDGINTEFSQTEVDRTEEFNNWCYANNIVCNVWNRYGLQNAATYELFGFEFPDEPEPVGEESVQVAASSDDCTSDVTDSYMQPLTNDWVGFGRSSTGTSDRSSGIRFLNVTIPAGATILTAKLIGKSYAAYSNTINAKIRGELSLSPATFSTYANFAARTRTTAAVDWDITASWASGETVETADITSIIQELIDQVGWTGSGDMVIFLENDGTTGSTRRNIRAYDYTGNQDGATLSITYSTEGATQYTQTLVELAGLNDGLALQADKLSEVSDVVGLTDQAVSQLHAKSALTDIAGLTDQVSVKLDGKNTLTDLLGLNDEVNVMLDYKNTLTDVVGLKDQVNAVANVNSGLIDQVGLKDGLEFVLSTFEMNLIDEVTLFDALTLKTSLNYVLADNVQLNDALSIEKTVVRSIDDGVSLNDNLAFKTANSDALSDAVGLKDSLTLDVTSNEMYVIYFTFKLPNGRRITLFQRGKVP